MGIYNSKWGIDIKEGDCIRFVEGLDLNQSYFISLWFFHKKQKKGIQQIKKIAALQMGKKFKNLTDDDSNKKQQKSFKTLFSSHNVPIL